MRRSAVAGAVLVGVVVSGCGVTEKPPEVVPPTPMHTTYRIIGGVSMGGIGASALGLSHPDKVDGVAMLGGPLDAAFFQRMTDQFILSGFCSREQLEAILASDPTKLNDPTVIDACARLTPTMKWEHQQDFNHWHSTLSGANFNRDAYVRLLTDLTLAYGSFIGENPDSPFTPPGLSPERVRHPPVDFCTNPLRLKNVINAEYNPDGKYDAITFCDGEPLNYFCDGTGERVNFCSDPANLVTPLANDKAEAFANAACVGKGNAVLADQKDHKLYLLDHAGFNDPCLQAVKPQGAVLALDMNGNGRRDYGEPVINNGRERFDDVGTDGCADELEDGKGGCASSATAGATDPNHDNYEVDENPLGTEQNWLWNEGEPYRDLGLDGVANTHDFGEGNGSYDMSTGRRGLLQFDGRTNYRKLDAAGRARISVMGDGGIRDVFNFGLRAKHLFSTVKALATSLTGAYRDFIDIPGMFDKRRNSFNPWNNRWSLVPRDLLLLYGAEQPTDQQRIDGEGDHVGTASEAINRFAVMFNWAARTWPSLERPVTPLSGATASERQKIEWFDSKQLRGKWEYSVALPPGYFDPANAEKRYPVVYMLHGYGMDPQGFMGTSLITDAYVTDTDVNFRPMIFVFPNGRCCWVKGDQADCREHDDAGNEFNGGNGWERECNSGTFWINRKGYTPTDARPYGDAMFELFDHIDASYRTMKPAEVEAR